MSRLIDLSNRRFGKLLVLCQSGRHESPGGHIFPMWECLCDCGKRTTVIGASLRAGHTKSCGCGRFKGRKPRLPEYSIWAGMLNRCRNPNVKAFPLYGGRGIKVCEEWLNFKRFYQDMGPRPSPEHSIERKDVDGNYEPNNCVWATFVEQANNRRMTRWVVYRGRRLSLCDAVREAGSVIHYEAAAIRIFRSGWTVERAVETPRLFESHRSKRRAA